MRSIPFLLTLAITAPAAMIATPAHAQRVAELAPGAPSYVAPAPAAAPGRMLAASRDLAPALRPPRVDVPDAAAPRRLSVVGHTAVGAGAGVLAGVLASAALFVFDEECTSGDSMCALAIPGFVGLGTVTGTVVGLVVGLVRNR